MTNQNLKLEELQKFIQVEHQRLIKIAGSGFDEHKRSLARTVKLMEELGELSNEIMAYYNDQRKEKISGNIKEKIAEECADVIIVTLLLAENINIDVYAALKEKIQKIRQRNLNTN